MIISNVQIMQLMSLVEMLIHRATIPARTIRQAEYLLDAISDQQSQQLRDIKDE